MKDHKKENTIETLKLMVEILEEIREYDIMKRAEKGAENGKF